MELHDILVYIKEFGIAPVLFAVTLLYLAKNKEKIFKIMADQIANFLQTDRQKVLEQLDNDLLIKDIQILELYLSNQTQQYFETILNVYERYKNEISEQIEGFKKEIEDYFKKTKDEIMSWSIRTEIIQYYQQEIKGKLIEKFLNRLFEAISMNGHSNIFRTHLKDLLNDLVRTSVDQIEKKFLYSKLK